MSDYHNGFQVLQTQGFRLLFGLGQVTPISGVPTGARVRTKVRHDEWVFAFVRFGSAITQHYVCLDSNDELMLGPVMAVNSSPAPTRSAR